MWRLLTWRTTVTNGTLKGPQARWHGTRGSGGLTKEHSPRAIFSSMSHKRRLLASTEQSPYTDAFFSERQPGSLTSARTIVPLLVDLFSPRSVVAVGCALGTWLPVCRSQ